MKLFMSLLLYKRLGNRGGGGGGSSIGVGWKNKVESYVTFRNKDRRAGICCSLPCLLALVTHAYFYVYVSPSCFSK